MIAGCSMTLASIARVYTIGADKDVVNYGEAAVCQEKGVCTGLHGSAASKSGRH